MTKKLNTKAKERADLFTVVHVVNRLKNRRDKEVILKRAREMGLIPNDLILVLDEPVLTVVEPGEPETKKITFDLEAAIRSELFVEAKKVFGHESDAAQAISDHMVATEKKLGINRPRRGEVEVVKMAHA